jgi:hypothetical protein
MKAEHAFSQNTLGDVLLHLRDERGREITKPRVVYQWPNAPKRVTLDLPPVRKAALAMQADYLKACELERNWNAFA